MRNNLQELIKGKYYAFKDGLTLRITYDCIIDYMQAHTHVHAASLLLSSSLEPLGFAILTGDDVSMFPLIEDFKIETAKRAVIFRPGERDDLRPTQKEISAMLSCQGILCENHMRLYDYVIISDSNSFSFRDHRRPLI